MKCYSICRINSRILFLFFCIITGGCTQGKSICTPESDSAQDVYEISDLSNLTQVPEKLTEPIKIEIGGKVMEVDKLVDYPLCNDHWSGIVYVSCQARVAISEIDEEDNPLFFKGCDLNIEPNTIVYVAAHNDTPYYRGCSCHTGQVSAP